jgi:hypothetical protein
MPTQNQSEVWQSPLSDPVLAPFLIKNIDHHTFPQVVGELVRTDPQFEGVLWTADFPKQRPETPTIAYRLKSRVPGLDRTETRKPRHRWEFRNEDGTITEMRGQIMDCVFQFDVCCTSAHEANELVWKLDTFIRQNVGVFKAMGAREVLFEEQLEDALLPRTDDIVTRSLRWRAILEIIESRNVSALNEVRVRVLSPQEEADETVVRGSDFDTLDPLAQTFISKIIYVSDTSPSGIARADDYIPGLDFHVIYDPPTNKTYLKWIEAGRHPEPGATYYVRYLHWTAFARLTVPFF